jgi:Protein related to penicillin acylase
MKSRIIKIVIRIGIALFLIALGGAVAVNYLVKRSIPNYESKKHLQGLSAPVQIFYDEFKAAHIIAETKRDLFFAQGYAHARERLWQMELQRRAATDDLPKSWAKVLSDLINSFAPSASIDYQKPCGHGTDFPLNRAKPSVRIATA